MGLPKIHVKPHKVLISVFDFQLRDGFDVDLEEEDLPTEEMIERMEERLETAQSEQKNLFLIIFQVSSFKFYFK